MDGIIDSKGKIKFFEMDRTINSADCGLLNTRQLCPYQQLTSSYQDNFDIRVWVPETQDFKNSIFASLISGNFPLYNPKVKYSELKGLETKNNLILIVDDIAECTELSKSLQQTTTNNTIPTSKIGKTTHKIIRYLKLLDKKIAIDTNMPLIQELGDKFIFGECAEANTPDLIPKMVFCTQLNKSSMEKILSAITSDYLVFKLPDLSQGKAIFRIARSKLETLLDILEKHNDIKECLNPESNISQKIASLELEPSSQEEFYVFLKAYTETAGKICLIQEEIKAELTTDNKPKHFRVFLKAEVEENKPIKILEPSIHYYQFPDAGAFVSNTKIMQKDFKESESDDEITNRMMNWFIFFYKNREKYRKITDKKDLEKINKAAMEIAEKLLNNQAKLSIQDYIKKLFEKAHLCSKELFLRHLIEDVCFTKQDIELANNYAPEFLWLAQLNYILTLLEDCYNMEDIKYLTHMSTEHLDFEEVLKWKITIPQQMRPVESVFVYSQLPEMLQTYIQGLNQLGFKDNDNLIKLGTMLTKLNPIFSKALSNHPSQESMPFMQLRN